MSRPSPFGLPVPRLAAGALLALLTATAAHAQLSRRQGDFPSWERDAQLGSALPLPEGNRGTFVPTISIPLDARATGLGVTTAEELVVLLEDGRLQSVDAEGEVLWEVDLAGEATRPPVVVGHDVLASIGTASPACAVARPRGA